VVVVENGFDVAVAAPDAGVNAVGADPEVVLRPAKGEEVVFAPCEVDGSKMDLRFP
jgi:hypothetical protein